MSMTRKGFLSAATGGSILLFLQACGGGGDSGSGSGSGSNGGGTGTSATSCGATGVAISGNHGHVLSIPVADLESTVDKTYDIQGSASHTHSITLTVAQLQMLKAGQAFTVSSTTTLEHSHNAAPSCV